MTVENNSECSESRILLSRRGFIGSATGLFALSVLPCSAEARSRGLQSTVVVILRGGIDGLSALIPLNEPDYESYRPEISNFSSSLHRINSDFALHPSMRNFADLFVKRELCVFPAVGLPVRTRSHFSCQRNLENGLPTESSSQEGWMARLLESPALRGGRGLAVGVTPSIFSGTSNVVDWSPTWFVPMRSDVSRVVAEMYQSSSNGLFRDQLRHQDQWRILDSLEVPRTISKTQQAFFGAARYIKGASSSVVAVVDVHGWDTHHRQGNSGGRLASILSDLDSSIKVFKDNVGERWASTTVIFVSEFGRTARENGTFGTDHGVAFPVFIAGGGIQGGVLGDWAGLRTNALVDGRDVRPTVDVRSIFKTVLSEQYGVTSRHLDRRVFPASRSARQLSGIF